jgi:low affinity Fe/Cu permease
MSEQSIFARFSHAISFAAGRPLTFVLACAGVAIWAISGPLFGFSETWQLVVNTATTIITFLMVFVLQNSQNRDGEALQAKLDEIIVALEKADDRFVAAERLSDEDLTRLRAMLVDQATEAAQELQKRSKSAPQHDSETA